MKLFVSLFALFVLIGCDAFLPDVDPVNPVKHIELVSGLEGESPTHASPGDVFTIRVRALDTNRNPLPGVELAWWLATNAGQQYYTRVDTDAAGEIEAVVTIVDQAAVQTFLVQTNLPGVGAAFGWNFSTDPNFN